jgi:hypothetical protein
VRRSSDVGVRFGVPARDRPFGHCGPTRCTAGPINRTSRFHTQRLAQAKRLNVERGMVNRTPLLRFSAPSALAVLRRAFAGDCQPTGCPASTVRRCRHLLRPDASQHRAPTPGRLRLVLAVFAFLALGRNSPRSCRARIEAAHFGRDAPPFRDAHRCIDVARRARCGSCAGAFLRPAFRYPRGGLTWPGRSPFGGEAFLGFRPVNVPDARSASGVTRVTVSLSTPSPDGAPGVPSIPSQVCSRGRVRVASPHPRTHVPFADLHPSRCFSRATGRPG